MQTIFIGAVNLVFTFLAMSLVDKVGRKPLLLTGSVGLAILYIAIASALAVQSPYASYLLLAAIGMYATTLAPVIWIVISEMFLNKYSGVFLIVFFVQYLFYHRMRIH